MTRYSYSCASKSGTAFTGTFTWHSKFDRDQLIAAIMSEISSMAFHTNVPWDPFNIQLIVKAQIEPKQYDGPWFDIQTGKPL